MTLLMVDLSRANGGVDIVTDTLVHTSDFSLSYECSKTLLLPHADTAIAMSGFELLKTNYFALAGGGALGSDFDEMVRATPEVLRDLSGRLGLDEASVDWQSKGRLSTIHLFGLSASEGGFGGFRFSAGDDFETAPYLDPGDGRACLIQPTAAGSPTVEEFTGWQTPEEIPRIAHSVREDQIALPPGERIVIGGRLVLTQLTEGFSGHQVLGLFDDSAELWDRYFDGMPEAAAKWNRNHGRK